MQQLQKDEIKIENCHLQCYDNAAVMVGHRNGVQQRIGKKTSRKCLLTVTIIHLTWWSLDKSLDVARQDTEMVSFFETINSLYNFFSRSILCWENLKDAVSLVLKAEAETCQSSRTEVVKPIDVS